MTVLKVLTFMISNKVNLIPFLDEKKDFLTVLPNDAVELLKRLKDGNEIGEVIKKPSEKKN